MTDGHVFRKDATLREVLTTLRNAAPQIAELRHPLARYSFRAIYADAANRGRFAQKELGMVYSRDILGEPGTLETVAPRLLDAADEACEPTEREKAERTLEELRFVAGDYLCVSILMPKGAAPGAGPGSGPGQHGAAHGEGAGVGGPKPQLGTNGWRGGAGPGRVADAGWGVRGGVGRGGSHWRGESSGAGPGGRGRGGRGDFGGREREGERGRAGPLRRDTPPHRGGRRGRRTPSGSRSRSPPRRRGSRYE